MPHTLTTALWGMTEGIGTSCRIGTPAPKVFTTDGQPFPGTELRVAGPDGAELPPGCEGELLMRGPQIFVGYFGRPDLNAECFLADGFFRTGDLAVMDAEGHLRITGRLKDLIVRGGVNISPVEIERALAEDPRVERVAIVGLPDERLGERICAFVVPRAGVPLALQDLVAVAERCGLAKQKWPERLECVSHIPTTPSGKIQRHVLRQWLQYADADAGQVPRAPDHGPDETA
jgi:non-ribosomal peptide synthetase component E (peptide arylation enzyme)